VEAGAVTSDKQAEALTRVREVAAGYRHRLNTMVMPQHEYEMLESVTEDIEDALADTCQNCGIRAVEGGRCSDCGAAGQ
jgi:hypothetical protein